jgi:hypothetical protein
MSPRIGHIHVTVDDATWHWADARGNPAIINGLATGRHTILIHLVNANHQPIDLAPQQRKGGATTVTPPSPSFLTPDPCWSNPGSPIPTPES